MVSQIRIKKKNFIIGYLLFVVAVVIVSIPAVRAWSTADFTCDEVEDKKSGNLTCHFRITNTSRYARNGCPDGAPTHVGYCDGVSDGCAASLTDPGCGNMTTVCELGCPCTDVNCPAVIPISKWRRTTSSNGSYNHCNGNSMNCNPTTGACDPSYVNSPVSCSITPTTVSGARGNGGVAFTLTANDADYGDEVRITGFNVKDTAGKLNNCVTLKTAGGGDVLGATVKVGFPDSNPLTSQSNTFIANPDLVHGIFQKDPVTGLGVCTGTLTVEVRDVAGDSQDTTSYATCSVNIGIRDNPPTISDITITDLDNTPSLRTSGNLINGSQLFIGSVLESKRASYCTSPLQLTLLGVDGCTNKVALRSRKNPFLVSYTINDKDGIKDILESGIWIQRADKGTTSRYLPLVENGVRNSIQARYSETENVTIDGKPYFNSRACLAGICSPDTIIGSPKQIFAGLSLITGLKGTRGAYSVSPYKSSSYRQWQIFGYPDCYLTQAGCTTDNIPLANRNLATADESSMDNYVFGTTADFNSLLCFKNTSAVVETIPAGGEKCLGSNEVCPVCPSTCAACAQKAGITPINDTTAQFNYKIYFNDRDGGTYGMDAGDYRIFVSALDKVGVSFNGAANDTDDNWFKFDKNGQLCTSGVCAAGDFVLTYDPIAPKVSNILPHIDAAQGEDAVTVAATYADNTNGSGIMGESYMYMITQEMLDGEPSERNWMKKSDGVTLYNGQNEHAAIIGAPALITVNHPGKGAIAGNNIVFGACTYDRAGNMGCGTNGMPYIFVSSWLKTTLGDIYSNSSSSGYAFKNLTIPNTPDKTSPNSAYAPYQYFGNSAATGIVMSGGNIGISGGLTVGTIDYPLGFSTSTSSPQEYYRTTDTGSLGQAVFNMTNFQANLEGSEYARMSALAAKNCELLTVKTPGACKTSTTIADTSDAAPVKIITLSGSVTLSQPIVCKNTNFIVVTPSSDILITGQVTKLNPTSTCLFLLGQNSTLTIGDIASDTGVSAPTVDKFEASVVAGQDAHFVVAKNIKGTTTKRYDRLLILGFTYSANIEPLFKRTLPSVDNKKYPAEWIVYDANVLDSYRELLGLRKTVDIVCGTSNHLLCGEK